MKYFAHVMKSLSKTLAFAVDITQNFLFNRFRSVRRVRRRSQLLAMAARGAWALRNIEEKAALSRVVRAAAALALAWALSPLLLLSFIGTTPVIPSPTFPA